MRSLDAIEWAQFSQNITPFNSCGKQIALKSGKAAPAIPNRKTSLNGRWEMVMEGDAEQWLNQEKWEDAIPANIPCSIHKALLAAGKIPEPSIGENQKIAKEFSFHNWFLRCRFAYQVKPGKRYRLRFDGVADRCRVWLNGKSLGAHQGMFGGPEADITDFLQADNVLLVHLEPIPFVEENCYYSENNASWRDTVVINNVYGWHYSNLPSLGIWQPVWIVEETEAVMEPPFVFTRNAQAGELGVALKLLAPEKCSGKLALEISPENFEGESYFYEETICLSGAAEFRYEFTLPEPRLWWPVDMGEANLYTLTAAFSPEEGESVGCETAFGIRTVEMVPLEGQPREDAYNWGVQVNGRFSFIRGTGWCTMDALLELPRERYDRFLRLAREQHVQMMRGWGCGLPETDDFYDLCDRYGIMILQEWPTAWNSHETQPFAVLEQTVREHTIRLRNHPSLIMYGAGNESSEPFGKMIDRMGALSLELDGTRPFHRGEPWGGSKHDYGAYWDRKHIDHHLTAEAPFWGEFGLPSIPIRESLEKYLPPEALQQWPLTENPGFVYHTPVFGHADDMARLEQAAHYFLPENPGLNHWIVSTQLTQALTVRRVLERSRARFPACGGALYYKMNDNFPAVSWACVDWYGAPKISHYVFQDSFEPLHGCLLLERLNFAGMPVEIPVVLMDDQGVLKGKQWEVSVRAYNEALQVICERTYSAAEPQAVNWLGSFSLTGKQTETAPLLLVCDVSVEGERKGRSFYFSNVEHRRGCMFTLPKASLGIYDGEDSVTVENKGALPAVGVWVSAAGHGHTASFSDNFLWLDAGEKQTIAVSGVDASIVRVSALNSALPIMENG